MKIHIHHLARCGRRQHNAEYRTFQNFSLPPPTLHRSFPYLCEQLLFQVVLWKDPPSSSLHFLPSIPLSPPYHTRIRTDQEELFIRCFLSLSFPFYCRGSSKKDPGKFVAVTSHPSEHTPAVIFLCWGVSEEASSSSSSSSSSSKHTFPPHIHKSFVRSLCPPAHRAPLLTLHYCRNPLQWIPVNRDSVKGVNWDLK